MTNMNCIFCQIVNGDLPSTRLYEDDRVVVFKDIAPKAPVHLLVVPREHVRNLEEAGDAQDALLGHMTAVAAKVAAQAGIAASGYRVVLNNGLDAGQVVFHLHLHVLGGQRLGDMG